MSAGYPNRLPLGYISDWYFERPVVNLCTDISSYIYNYLQALLAGKGTWWRQNSHICIKYVWIYVCMYVREFLSVHMKHLRSQRTDCYFAQYFVIFSKICRELSSHITNTKNFTSSPVCFMILLRWILLWMRNVLFKIIREIKTTFYFQKTYSENTFMREQRAQQYL